VRRWLPGRSLGSDRLQSEDGGLPRRHVQVPSPSSDRSKTVHSALTVVTASINDRSLATISTVTNRASSRAPRFSIWAGHGSKLKPQGPCLRKEGGGRHSQNYHTSIALCADAFFTPTSKLRRIGVTISSRRSGLYAPLANLSRMHPPWFSASNWDLIDFSVTFCSRVGLSRVRPRLA
jgi:hypothetical protein